MDGAHYFPFSVQRRLFVCILIIKNCENGLKKYNLEHQHTVV